MGGGGREQSRRDGPNRPLATRPMQRRGWSGIGRVEVEHAEIEHVGGGEQRQLHLGPQRALSRTGDRVERANLTS